MFVLLLRGIELEEIRVYNYGDDVRDIDCVTAVSKSLIPKSIMKKKTEKYMFC